MDATMQENKIHLRYMEGRDLDAVIEIGRQPYGCEWSEKTWSQIMGRTDVIGLVAMSATGVAVTVAGFAIYQLRPKSFEIRNIGVRPDLHRRGVGRKLVDKLTSKLCALVRPNVLCRVPDDNLPAQLFFQRCDFVCRQIDHAANGDRYVMQWDLSSRGGA